MLYLRYLQKRLEDVTQKFKRFQRPADFEPKLGRVSRMLNDVQDGCTQLTVTSHDPDDIQDKLNHCMHFYKILSDVKAEVEHIIKQGRQIVEKEQVENPKELTQRLDNLKQLYNQLGAQVTEGKLILERILRTCKKFKNDKNKVDDWLTSSETELDKREATIPPKDLNEEISFCKDKLNEMSKLRVFVECLRDGVDPLCDNLADRNNAAELKEDVKEMERQWDRLELRLNNRLGTMEVTLQAGNKVLNEFRMSLSIVQSWIDKHEPKIDDIHDLFLVKEAKDEHVSQSNALQTEMVELKCRVDTLRDLAVDIMSKSESYEKEVEPSLSSLNLKWEEVTSKMKVYNFSWSIRSACWRPASFS